MPVPIPPRRDNARSESPHQNGWAANRGGDRYVPMGGYSQPGPPQGAYNGAFGGPSSLAGGYDDRLKRGRSVSPPYRRPYAGADDRYAPRPRFEAPYPGPSSYLPAYDSYRPAPMLDRRMDMPPMGSSAPAASALDAYDRNFGANDRSRRNSPPPVASRIEDRLGPIPDREPEKPKAEWTDPNLLEYKVPLHYYVMWWRENHPEDAPKTEGEAKTGVQPTPEDEKRYQQYLSDLKTRQVSPISTSQEASPDLDIATSSGPSFSLIGQNPGLRKSMGLTLNGWSFGMSSNERTERAAPRLTLRSSRRARMTTSILTPRTPTCLAREYDITRYCDRWRIYCCLGVRKSFSSQSRRLSAARTSKK